jgi:hypothetical protein
VPLTTPNAALLFKRLLLGRQPVYRYHVREYAISEVVSIVETAGFRVVEAYYSIINDLTLVDGIRGFLGGLCSCLAHGGNWV